jgi:hypothetical protein
MMTNFTNYFRSPTSWRRIGYFSPINFTRRHHTSGGGGGSSGGVIFG